MAHQRQVIRDAVVAALIAADTAAETRVYPTRAIPIRRQTWPAIAVYTLEETVEADSVNTAPRELTRNLALAIEAWVDGGAGNVDDAIDALCEEIETAMHADPYFGGACGESVLANTEIEVVEAGDRLMGAVTLTYDVTYRTLAPEAPADEDLDDFLRVEATHNVGGDVHEDDEAVDDFVVQEVA